MSDSEESAQEEKSRRDKGKEKVKYENKHNFPWERITPEEREALKKRYRVKLKVSNRWKGYIQSLADSATDASTFLGGAAFVGVTLTFGTTNRSIFETVIVLEVLAFSCFILAIIFSGLLKLDCLSVAPYSRHVTRDLVTEQVERILKDMSFNDDNERERERQAMIEEQEAYIHSKPRYRTTRGKWWFWLTVFHVVVGIVFLLAATIMAIILQTDDNPPKEGPAITAIVVVFFIAVLAGGTAVVSFSIYSCWRKQEKAAVNKKVKGMQKKRKDQGLESANHQDKTSKKEEDQGTPLPQQFAKSVEEKWRNCITETAESISSVSTFLGGSAFVGVTLALPTTSQDLFDATVVVMVIAFFFFMLALFHASLYKLDAILTGEKIEQEVKKQLNKGCEIKEDDFYVITGWGMILFLSAMFFVMCGMLLLLASTIMIALLQTEDPVPSQGPSVIVTVLVSLAGVAVLVLVPCGIFTYIFDYNCLDSVNNSKRFVDSNLNVEMFELVGDD